MLNHAPRFAFKTTHFRGRCQRIALWQAVKRRILSCKKSQRAEIFGASGDQGNAHEKPL
jgi:hypothetical protein